MLRLLFIDLQIEMDQRKGCICPGVLGAEFSSLPWYVPFWKPDLVWKLTEEWKSYCADEPSEFYLKVTKIRGILFALFGIAAMILPFIVE